MESRVAHDERTRSIDDKERMNMNLPAIIGKSSGNEVETADRATTEANTEAFRVLVDRARRKTGKIPPETIARLAMAVVPAHEFPVRLEALDAIIRRWDGVKRDQLRVADRPKGSVLGLYSTRRHGAKTRPYRTLIRSVDPIDGSCDCPDFTHNSLGICKHIFTVLAYLYEKPGLIDRAARDFHRSRTIEYSRLVWDPVRPLTGTGDWLDRVSWFEGLNDFGSETQNVMDILSFHFREPREGYRKLRSAHADDHARRLTLVKGLNLLVSAARENQDFDPALESLLAREESRLRSIAEHELTTSERRAAWKGLKKPLYSYQREGVNKFLETGRLLLADDMGLGKTAQAIACCDILHRLGRVERGLIVTPASLKPQWKREWGEFSRLPIEIVDGSPAERARFFETTRNGFLIINYEQVIRDLETIRAWAPDFVVLDEAQRIKNWATKTALSVKGLNPRYRLVLTGTPMENRIDELASIVEWVDELALEPKWRLAPLHAIRSDGRKEVVGVKHLDTLRSRLAPCMIRRVRQEVLDQLPPRTDVRTPIEMTAPQRDEHDNLSQPILQIMQRSLTRPLTQAEFLKLMSLLTMQRIISNGLAQMHFDDVWPTIRDRAPDETVLQGLFAPKLIELRTLVRQLVLEQGRKVVIFSQWRRMLALAYWAVNDILAGQGLRAGLFTGAEGGRRRTQNIVEFHDDPSFRILFATDAGGVGLNLQHASNCVINLELPWNPAVLEQRIGRIYRLGQKQPIDVYNLVCEEGIESRIATILGSKQAFFKGLFDGDSDSLRFDQSASFLSRIQKLIDPSLLSPQAEAAEGFDQAETIDLSDVDVDLDSTEALDLMIDQADEALALTSSEIDLSESAITTSNEPGKIAQRATNGSIDSAVDHVLAPDSHGGEPASFDHRSVDRETSIEARTGSDSEPASAPILPREVARLFGDIDVRREPGGKVVIEAGADAAESLIALFQGMAGLLKSVSSKPEEV